MTNEDHLTVLSTALRADATTVASLLATVHVCETPHIVHVDTGTVPLRFQSADTLAAGNPGVDLTGLPVSGLASLIYRSLAVKSYIVEHYGKYIEPDW